MWIDLPNWQAASSFTEPVAPVGAEPDSAPTVCVQFAASWLPYVLGSLMQLTQPAAWATSDPTALQTVLTQAMDLCSLFGAAEACTVLSFQFTSGCELEYSTDGGATWTVVPGWPTYAAACYTGPAGPEGPPGTYTPGVPGNPQGATVDQQACNIAGFLATEVIKAALQATVTAIQASESLYTAGLAVLGVLIGPDPVLDLVLLAANYIYGQVAGGTIAHYTTALSDATLWAAVTCAIYLATNATGYVTALNFAAVVAAVGAITYTYPDVITTLVGWLNNLGATGLMALQIPGAMAVIDCSACGTFCIDMDLTAATGPWAQYSGNPTHWVNGVGWTNNGVSSFGGVGTAGPLTAIEFSFLSRHIDTIEIWGSIGTPLNGLTADYQSIYVSPTIGSGYTVTNITPAGGTGGTGAFHLLITPNTTLREIIIECISRGPLSAANTISRIKVRGTGANPFGTTNCVY